MRRNWLSKFPSHFLRDATLCAILIAAVPCEVFAAEKKVKEKKEDASELYSFNFPSISMLEFVKYVAQISELNFIFEGIDLGFEISVLSDEPTSVQSIMSAMTQIIRAHGLVLIEDGSNAIITKSSDVNQIAKVVDENGVMPKHSPLVTKVFRIKNTSPTALATIIGPMMSKAALVEVSATTRQLIITDIVANVKEAENLINAIDAPQSALKVEMYNASTIGAAELALLTKEILNPLAEGNPLIIVPQMDASRIFIVTTPFLQDMAKAVIADLDARSHSKARVGNFTLYKITQAHEEQIRSSLQAMAHDLKKMDIPDEEVIRAIGSMKWIKETNSLFFTGTPRALSVIESTLPKVDVPPATSFTPLVQMPLKNEFRIFTPKNVTADDLQTRFHEIASKLEHNHLADPAFLRTLTTIQWIPGSNSFVATGDKNSLDLMAKTIATLDDMDATGAEKGVIVTLHHLTRNRVEGILTNLLHHIDNKSPSGKMLASAVSSITWLDNTTFRIHGSPRSVEEITNAIALLDTSDNASAITFDVIHLEHAQAQAVVDSLKALNKTHDKGHLGTASSEAIAHLEVIPDINSIYVRGTPAAIAHIQELITQYDQETHPSSVLHPTKNNSNFKIFNNVPNDTATALQQTLKHLKAADLNNPDLMNTKVHVTEKGNTSTLTITGTEKGVKEVSELLESFLPSSIDSINDLGSMTFYVHKRSRKTKEQINQYLQTLVSPVMKAGSKSSLSSSTSLVQVIKAKEWVTGTDSLLFYGPKRTVEQIREQLNQFDPPQNGKEFAGDFDDYEVYDIKSTTSADALIADLQGFAHSLHEANISKPELERTIYGVQPSRDGSSLIIPGHKEITSQVIAMLKKYDTNPYDPDIAFNPSEDLDFSVIKLQYQQGGEILVALKQIAIDMAAQGTETNASLIAAINSLQWIQPTNSLIVIEKKETVKGIHELIKNLDVRQKQVFIEVLVIETTLDNSQSFGLEWGSKVGIKNRISMGAGNFPPPVTANGTSSSTSLLSAPLAGAGTTGLAATNGSVPFVGGFDLGIIGDILFHKGRSFLSLGSLVNALQQDSDSTIILNPKIVTQDNQTSTTFSGSNLPFVGTQVVNASTNTTTSTSLEYRDIGVNLTITPMLGNKDKVATLDISLDISERVADTTFDGNASGTTTTANTSVTGIATSHTSMSTRVHVPDKHFLVLSGLIRETKGHQKTGIPCLGGLPVIGAAFSKNDRSSDKNNLIIFVRPTILETDEIYDEVSLRQEELYEKRAVLPFLREEFVDGIEMIKTDENE